MTGPAWEEDLNRDRQRIVGNAQHLARDIRASAGQRSVPPLSIARRWHEVLYSGCHVPSPEYVGNYRGDARFPDLVGYEVGTRDVDAVGRNLWMGVYATRVQSELDALEPKFHQRLAAVDAYLPVGVPPTTAEQLEQVAVLAAAIHGEWVRIHPFANGNGRTARVWTNFVTARYSLPSVWGIKPRPSDPSYVRAVRSSLGQAPDFTGDHSPTVALLAHLLKAVTGPP